MRKYALTAATTVTTAVVWAVSRKDSRAVALRMGIAKGVSVKWLGGPIVASTRNAATRTAPMKMTVAKRGKVTAGKDHLQSEVPWCTTFTRSADLHRIMPSARCTM